MNAGIQFQHLKIQLEDLTLATNNFNDATNCIGGGGFGKVYKGQLVSHSKGRSMAAIKRLDPRHGQGIPEFLKEITTLSRYTHDNLISLLGFCYQGDENEMILVYEHASRGSLDRHLNSPHLTWSQRLKICLDAAKGLSYLHDPRETHQRLIHCDVKSANILLDDQWNAKVSDFGLSIMAPANEQQSIIVTAAAGTPGYCDPQYAITHTLTKESDVYSLGVVLIEVLCGTLCFTHSINGDTEKNFVRTWIESYKQKKLNDIIFKNETIQPLDQISLEKFSNIAYLCLEESRKDRPKMAEVVAQLETALDNQEFSEWINLRIDYEEMAKTVESPLNYSFKDEVRKLLLNGVLLKGGKTWFSLNKNGERCEMISFAECLDPEFASEAKSEFNSRFTVAPHHYKNGMVKTRVKAQFLSPGITYTVNLVFKFTLPRKDRKCHDRIALKYKLQGEKHSSISYLAYEREDGWWMCELYQFTSDRRTIDLEILFNSYTSIEAEGIEFRPLEKVNHKDENQPISDSNVNWEEKLLTDYEDVVKCFKNNVQWTTKKEAYSIIRKGFLIEDGKKKSIWFYLDKNGKKCHMLSARAAASWDLYSYKLSLPESRFGEAFQCVFRIPDMMANIQSQLVSSETTYATYLVYKLPKDQSRFEAPILVEDRGDLNSNCHCYIYLTSPQTPVIRPKANQNAHGPLNKPKFKGLPRPRNDGWMEVQIWEFKTGATTEMIPVSLALGTRGDKHLSGLIIEGLEFRPI
ncbi:hypothetical protein QVD17_26935 [Tagetes erecta]|uniref:Protein kinase domain-containing protein n=1 Tax=Tagetes erecta TaxID=13708 RepID=A0AAD8KAB2_TARER|nr:hypothetical protein QVD17_26935 [Tagetes erecta]